MPKETESVKIDAKQIQRVREHVVFTREKIGAFISSLIEKEMDFIEKSKSPKKRK